jgi:predicted PurR-regulated permease PerM
VLIGQALFIAIGLEPAVAWLVRHGLRRWAAVTLVSVGSLGLILGFLAAVIPPLVAQGTAFASRAPAYLRAFQDHNSVVGKLNERFHLQQGLDQTLNGGTASMLNGVLGAGAGMIYGIIGALVAIPIAAATLLVVQELLLPRLDQA